MERPMHGYSSLVTLQQNTAINGSGLRCVSHRASPIPAERLLPSLHDAEYIDACHRAARRASSQTPVRLLLAGRFAWQTGEVKTAFEAARYRSDIQFLGYVPEADLKRLMASALALVYVSLSEGFGLPVLEAFHAEVPVICSSTTALPEVAGPAALLVDPVSDSAIAEALQQVWENEDLRLELIARGRLQCQAFDWEQAAQAVYQAIRAAADR